MAQRHNRKARAVNYAEEQHYQAFLRKLGPEHFLAYVDETHRRDPREPGEQRFYTVVATVVRVGDFGFYDRALSEIAGSRWHSTEALLEGRNDTFVELLKFCRDDPTMNIVVTTSEVVDGSDEALEAARQGVLGALFERLSAAEPNLRGFVLDRRRNHVENNNDRATFARLQREGKVGTQVALKHISSGRDKNLWLADTVAMAHRRSITHVGHVSGGWFNQYLRHHAYVYDLSAGAGDYRANPATLQPWLAELQGLQDGEEPAKPAKKGPYTPLSDMPIQQLLHLHFTKRAAGQGSGGGTGGQGAGKRLDTGELSLVEKLRLQHEMPPPSRRPEDPPSHGGFGQSDDSPTL